MSNLGASTIARAISVAAAVAALQACGGGASATTGDGGANSGPGGDAAGGGQGVGGGIGVGGGLGSGGSSASTGCTQVDFLFVVDNSVSMQDQQEALITSFPGFIEAIQQTVAASSDYHIMVVDSDAWGRCNTANGWTGSSPSHSTCNNYIKNTTFEECDRTLGAGVVHPAGQASSNQLCTLEGGNRFIVESEPDVTGSFECIARVGLAGHAKERPMDAMVAALSNELNGTGGCNEGFLRDDAILVVTFISDDPNYEDAGEPSDWYAGVVAAKGGNAEAVVVLGLTPNFTGCQDGKGPPKGAHWSEFISLWGDRGLEASVCDDDYTPFFAEAVSLIDETCDEFEPPS